MAFTLFVDGYFVNQYDATCYVALEEKGVTYSISRALLHENQTFVPAMHAKTRIARVPAMQHDDFWLTESMAIVEYLDDVLPSPRLLPADYRERARARQIMAWLRFELRSVREERPWYRVIYREPEPPLSAKAACEVKELFDLVARLDAGGDLGTWNIAHVDLALTLVRLVRTEELPRPARRLLDEQLARPSVKSYMTHARPPHAPP